MALQNASIGQDKEQRECSPRRLFSQHRIVFLQFLVVCLAVIVLSGAHCHRERLESTSCSDAVGDTGFRVG